MVFPIVAIIVLIVTLLAGAGIVLWVVAVIEVVRVVLTIIAIPFLVKFFADDILNYMFKLDEKVSLLLGLMFAIPVAFVLYLNFWALLIGSSILIIIYIFGWAIVSENSKALFSLKSWFKKGGK